MLLLWPFVFLVASMFSGTSTKGGKKLGLKDHFGRVNVLHSLLF